MTSRNRETAVPVVSDEPVLEYEIGAFELLWAKHRGAIVAAVAGALLIAIGVFAYFIISNANRRTAEAAFSSAETAREYRDVIAKHGGFVVAGEAYLLLAEKLRSDGKMEEADAALEEFVEKKPEHPFAPLALLALANNAAAAGDFDAAYSRYQSVADRYSKSFAAPVALGNKAELYLANGKREEALTTLQVQQRIFPKAIATEIMAPQIETLETLIGKPVETPAPPAPAPSPNS